MPRILLIDDDRDFSPLLAEALQNHGHCVDYQTGAEEGLQRLSRHSPPECDLVLLDQNMPRMGGLEFLAEVRRREIRLPVLLFTGWDAADVAIRASKLGAFRYLTKPNDLEPASLAPLLREINRAAEAQQPQPTLDDRNKTHPGEDTLVGACEAMRAVHWQIGDAANHDRPVLFLGEVGTGKYHSARCVHHYSSCAERSLLLVNCLAFADEDGIADRLFGYEAGMLSDGRARLGVFEQAEGGAVLLTHFHRLCLSSQARLAEVIRSRIVYRNGRGALPRPVRTRILASSSENLPHALAEGRLSWELYSLLGENTIFLPPLRERGNDIPVLARHFLQQFATESQTSVRALEPRALASLLTHPWPGNIRELQSVLRRALRLCRGNVIEVHDLLLDSQLSESQPTIEEPVSSSGSERKLPLSRERAYRAFLDAIRREPALAEGTDAEVFAWLKRRTEGEEDGLPASCETFQRYLREARAFYDTPRNSPRAGRPMGRSVVRPDQI